MGCRSTITRIISFILTLLVGIGIISQPTNTPYLTTQEDAAPAVTAVIVTATETWGVTPTSIKKPGTVASTSTDMPHFTRPNPGSICSFDPIVESLMNNLTQADWVNWIELLSGEKPVGMNGETYTILTRYSDSMFNGNPDARAYDFVLSQLRLWGYEDGISLFEQEFRPAFESATTPWKNIIVVIPGSDPELAQQQVLLTAHLDSTSQGDPEMRAPGADDNGGGVGALLEAVRIWRDLSFKRTIKVIFFTGEEQGLHGSRAYVRQFQNELEDIVGVLNLDMFGYDADNDRCFEIHVGRSEDSNLIGGCLADTIEVYDMNLTFDYLVSEARGSSDHSTFWDMDVGAVEVLENFDTHIFENGCTEADINPNYHTEKDLVGGMNLETAHAIARAAIATVARLAEPVEN